MSDQQYRKVPGEIGGDLSDRLTFLADLSNRLAGAEDAPAVLEAACPGALARLMTVGSAPSARTSGARTSGARTEDPAQAEFDRAVTGLAKLALENAALRERLIEQLRVGDSIATAADLQQSLQPDCAPGHLPIWGVNRPARKVSGDFFDFYRLDDGRIAFALGDVSGKGMNAALLMAKAISLFRCLGKRIDRPAQLLEAINAELCETATRGMFVTMVAGHYQTGSGTICLANAGHQPPLLRGRDRSYTAFPASAPPLGILPRVQLSEEHIDLAGGELYVFTDGLTEYRYVSGEELGVDGLIQLIESLSEAPLARRLETLLQNLEQDEGWEVRDDLTVLAIDDSWVEANGVQADGVQADGVQADEVQDDAGSEAAAGQPRKPQ